MSLHRVGFWQGSVGIMKTPFFPKHEQNALEVNCILYLVHAECMVLFSYMTAREAEDNSANVGIKLNQGI